MRCFSQCQDSYEQAGKCAGDWRQKGGLGTPATEAVPSFLIKSTRLHLCFPCTVPCTYNSTSKMRVSPQFLAFCVLSRLHLPWQTTQLFAPSTLSRPASIHGWGEQAGCTHMQHGMSKVWVPAQLGNGPYQRLGLGE